MSLSTTPSLDSSVRPSFASGYASPLTGGMAHPDLWRGVVGAWCPSLGATGGTLRDLSGNHNHGTLANTTLSTVWQPDGLDLDGTDDHVSLDSDTVNFSERTVSLWFKADSLQTAMVFAGGTTSGNRWYMWPQSDGTIDTSVGANAAVQSSIGYTAGDWVHYCVTYDAVTAVAYINGRQGSSESNSTLVGASFVTIGSYNRGSSDNFDGTIDDVLTYSRALTANEVAKLYRLGPAGLYQRKQPVITTVEPPTVEPAGSVGAFITSEVKPSYASGYASPITGGMAHESLWDGVVGAWCPSLGATGETLRDLSGNHNHGALTNMTLADAWADPRGLTSDGTNDYVAVGDLDVLDAPVRMTWAVRFRPDAWANNDFVIEKGGVFTLGQHASIVGANGGFTVVSDGAWKPVNFASSPTIGEWVDVVATLDGAVLSLYVDGEFVTSRSDIGTTVNSASDFNISGRGTTFPFNGAVGEVTIWNRALTPNEISTLYRLGPGGIYERKIYVPYTQPTVEPAGSVVAFITSEVKPSYASGYASPITGGMAHESLWDGVVGAWCPSLGATGGTLRDLSGNHNHGTLTNMTLADAWADPNGMAFDGSDDQVQLGNPETLQLEAGPISIAMWSYDNTGTNSLITKGESRASIYLRTFDIFDTGSQLRFHGLSPSGVSWAADTTTRPALGEWHHVVATWDGTTGSGAAKLYVDGLLAGSATPTTASLTAGDDWFLGGEGGFYQFDGTIDDVRIYSRALPQNEVAELHRLGPAGIYQRKQPVITTPEEVVGGLSIPIAAYHYNHNVGSRL